MEGMKYQDIIQTIVSRHSVHHSNGNTEVQLVFDTNRNQYLLLHLGWEDNGMRRVYGCTIHIQLKENGKIWIQRDGTEIGVANELVEAGVPKEDIVLAYKAPYKRKYTGFATE